MMDKLAILDRLIAKLFSNLSNVLKVQSCKLKKHG